MARFDVGDQVTSIRRRQADSDGEVLEILSPDTVWIGWGARDGAWLTECAERTDALVLVSMHRPSPASKTA
jgi:hypothetical protein